MVLGSYFQKHLKKTSLVKSISKIKKKGTEAVYQNAVFKSFVKSRENNCDGVFPLAKLKVNFNKVSTPSELYFSEILQNSSEKLLYRTLVKGYFREGSAIINPGKSTEIIEQAAMWSRKLSFINERMRALPLAP